MGDEASVRAGQADSTAGPVAEGPGPDLVRREILIPGGHGAAFAARAGQLVEITDLEGQQVADFVAFAERNRTEWLSTTHTRSALLRLTAVVGDRLELQTLMDSVVSVSACPQDLNPCNGFTRARS